MKRNWAASTVAAGAVLLAAVLAPSLALAGSAKSQGGSSNPQAPAVRAITPNVTVAPDACLLWQEKTSGQQRYRKTNNMYRTYYATDFGSSYFNVDCGTVTFTVPRGKQALVDLSATAELDCQGPTGGNSWCVGRFLVNGSPVAAPDNTGRSDTYAWDSANGGYYDWQAHSLAQEYKASCPSSTTTTTPCVYRVTLQSRLDNGATGIWVDDLTVRVDVVVAATSVTVVNP